MGPLAGLSSAYNLSRRFPDKKIVPLEGACCGYGASGRNGGFSGVGIPGLMSYAEEAGPELGETSELTDLFVVNHEIPYAGPSSLRHLSARLYKWYLKKASGKTTR